MIELLACQPDVTTSPWLELLRHMIHVIILVGILCFIGSWLWKQL